MRLRMFLRLGLSTNLRMRSRIRWMLRFRMWRSGRITMCKNEGVSVQLEKDEQ